MILTVPLQPGTTLANVRYKWIAGGIEGSELSVGVTQPDTGLPVFRFNIIPPTSAEELIVYDSTDANNWNVGGYKIAAISQAAATTTATRQATGSVISSRAIPFKRVFDKVLRWHGINPIKAIPPDLAFTVVERINDRVRLICNAWPWPEWIVTEERAFRPIWNGTDQFARLDEVFYLGAAFVSGGEFGTGFGYYRVLSTAPGDPPVGTLPTNTTYWEAMTPVDTYIAYDQRCRRSIGEMIGVYSRNPRVPTGSANGLMQFMPSERGIDVRGVGNSTVFITYKMPVPEYTIIPYVSGKTYVRGDTVFDVVTGECFQAVTTTSADPSNANYWRWMQFPRVWETYVTNGAFADSMFESDQSGDGDMQQRMVKAQAADERATSHLQSAVDSLTTQGQRLQWNFRRHYSRWCSSQPWTASYVTTLTDACQDELGWVYPTQPTFCDTAYHSEIVELLTADGTPSLQQLSTTTRSITCTQITITIEVSGSPEVQTWRLDSGAADGGDPGQVAPDDYNSVTNDKHWTKVG